MSQDDNSPSSTANTNPEEKSGRKIRYAVVGLGYISQVAILPGFAHAGENSELAAIVSGDPAKLRALAKKYKVPRTYNYEQYADCLADGIDAVYIALPNSMHRAYAEGAARAGVHVLCEKPMAVTEQECEAIIEAADKAKTKLMIAYRLHFERGNLSVIESIRQGRIGEPRIFDSVFCQQVSPGNSRLERGLGGGPVFDIGIYCINAARNLFGAEPYEVFAYSASGKDERFQQIPEVTSALLKFPEDRLASFTCSFGAADRSEYEIVGTKGSIRMNPAYEMVGDLKSETTVDGKTQKARYKKRDQFGAEVTYFSNCILKDEEPEPNGLEGLVDVRIINAIQESAEKGKPMAIKPIEKKERPTMEQELHKPAVEQPPLVRAQSPSQ